MEFLKESEKVLDTKYRNCYWNKSTSVLYVSSFGYIPEDKYIHATSEVLIIIKKYNPKKILFDFKDYRAVSENNREWVKENYLKVLYGNGVRYIAGVVGDVFGKIVITNLFAFIETQGIKNYISDSEKDAIDWLLSK